MIKKFFARESKDIHGVAIDPRSDDDAKIVADNCYFQVRLQLMKIANYSRFFREYYPVIHGNITFGSYGNIKDTTVVVTPEIPGEDSSSRLNKVFLRGQNLTEISVYRGGDIGVQIGLYAAPGDDWAQEFLNFAKSISEVANNTSLSAAFAVAGPIKSAIDGLLSRNKLSLQLGLKVQLFAAGLKKNKRFLLIGSGHELEPGTLSFDGTDVVSRGRIVGEADIVLLDLDFVSERDDLSTHPIASSAKSTLDSIVGSLLKGGANSEAEITESYRRFAAEVMVHESFTIGDKARLIAGIKANINEVRGAVGPPASVERSGSDIQSDIANINKHQPDLLQFRAAESVPTGPLSIGDAMSL
ncbi:hypothetical protein [Mesorhizobium sp.]|uniref:hypothetical protein n=1 Tax=Mesorhizobium sp. TaxID=1871066 RepID=UPI000FE5045F|nr:hypothetical protein [Mesorhizobium sp.]RWD71065.1 MAG: hypothetical protein EOS37_12700 [Mesorhizobium sp.]TIV32664.1 MAG: hypothetical protein E5V90_02010 [Mesorhizobium sp.]